MNYLFDKFYNSIDTSYTEDIIDKLSAFGDDPETGNRSAGSPACTAAAKYLYEKFNEIGLTSVTADKYKVNGWTFKGADLQYENEKNELSKIVLGGFATNFVTKDQCVKLVYGGKGSNDELTALGDITGKLILISPLNTTTDNWVNYPSYQAYVKGAAGVIVATTHKILHEDILISNDISAPSYCKALSISIKDANTLIKLIDVSDSKEIQVTLNSNSTVIPYATSYNIWGEIKGKTDEVIYLISHYDGYYHSYFDDASGVSEILGIAKGLIDSSYDNTRTIRFIAHGAEEWGKGYSNFDWAAGAYEQIMHLHPEWPKNAFALINIDGNFPIKDEKNFVIYSSPELNYFARTVNLPTFSKYKEYNFKFKYPVPVPYEDFIYQKSGIPCITAGDDLNKSIYYQSYYHSSMDNKKAGFDRRTHRMIQELYGTMVMTLDKLILRPMDFFTTFANFKKSFNKRFLDNKFENLLQELCYYGKMLTNKIYIINSNFENYSCQADDLNYRLYKLYKMVQDSFLALDYNGSIVYPHSLCQANLLLLYKGLDSLHNKSESLKDIINNYLLNIDGNKYAFQLDKKAYDFLVNRQVYGNDNSFGEKMYMNPNEDLYDVIHSLNCKYQDDCPDLTEEIALLEKAYNNQLSYLNKVLSNEYLAVSKIINYIKEIIH